MLSSIESFHSTVIRQRQLHLCKGTCYEVVNCMLCLTSPFASLSYRHTSLGVTKEKSSGLWSTSRVRSHRPKAFFGKKQGNSDQHHDDFLASSWGGEQPDWTEAPHQRDVLDEVWYEASTSGQKALVCLLHCFLLVQRCVFSLDNFFLCRRMLPLRP